MQSLRILIMTHAPLSPEFGAGQMTINLGEAFRELGHDVTLWSSHPVPQSNFNIFSLFQHIWTARKKFDCFLANEAVFDIIDCSAVYISKQVLRSGTIVVSRSVQPEVLYLIHDLFQTSNFRNLLRKPFDIIDILLYTFYLIQGWQRASLVLCLGSLGFEWTKNKVPWISKKLDYYVNALASKEQQLLSKIRIDRKLNLSDSVRFLWVGRWSSHKGTSMLVKFILEQTNVRPDDSFTIAGCGSSAENDIPSHLIDSGRVKIIPTFDREDLYSLLAEHDVGLFTSKVEGWGLVLNEMLESGMNVYATNAGGVVDLMPLFPNLLRSFPVQSTISNQNNHDFRDSNWQKYYEHFTWTSIANHYLNQSAISSKLTQSEGKI